MTPENSLSTDFERHLARLLVVLYHCGQPVANLIDGETRQVDSLTRLQRFDFWVREPGHLALALLHAYSATPDRFAETLPLLRETLSRVMADDQGDIRRMTLPGAPYAIYEDFDTRLSFLTSRALVSDRPSFTRSRSVSHRVVLEMPGTALVQRILESCPSFGWYHLQCEAVAVFYPLLDKYDLTTMTYLAPDLNPALAARSALLPIIRLRYTRTFGEPAHVDV
jgi:hypothetical protein